MVNRAAALAKKVITKHGNDRMTLKITTMNMAHLWLGSPIPMVKVAMMNLVK